MKPSLSSFISNSVLVGILSVVASAASAQATKSSKFAGFKDSEFANTRVLQNQGDLTLFDYRETRDVNGRDQVPGKVAKADRFQKLKRGDERRLNLNGFETFEAGDPQRATFAVVFIHGGGGDGTLGFSDVSFGGNFNRLKNLVVQNGGVYESPSMRNFSDLGAIQRLFNRINPNAKIIMACGSMGGQTCWKTYGSPQLAGRLAGIVLLGAQAHGVSRKEAGLAARVPVYLAHGTKDPVFGAKSVMSEFQSLQAQGLPSKLALYQNGRHGTPIRMVNWLDVMNWML